MGAPSVHTIIASPPSGVDVVPNLARASAAGAGGASPDVGARLRSQVAAVGAVPGPMRAAMGRAVAGAADADVLLRLVCMSRDQLCEAGEPHFRALAAVPGTQLTTTANRSHVSGLLHHLTMPAWRTLTGMLPMAVVVRAAALLPDPVLRSWATGPVLAAALADPDAAVRAFALAHLVPRASAADG